jgi:hypothetical protein
MESVLLATKQQAAISSDQPWSGFVPKLAAGQMTALMNMSEFISRRQSTGVNLHRPIK